MKSEYKANIWKFYLFKIVNSLEFTIPIFVLFLLGNGLNMIQVMSLEIAFIATVFLLEVPSGAFADMFGRKTSLVMSLLFGCVGFIFFGFGSTYSIFFISQVFVGLAVAFHSGADSAFIYDSLKEIKKEKNFSKIFGIASSMEIFIMGTIGFIGGFLAIYMGYRNLFFLTAVSFFLASMIGLSFKEPPIHKKLKEKNYLKHLHKSIKFAYNHKIVRNMIIYFSLFAALGHLTYFIIQPYYDGSTLPKYFIGIVVGFYMISFGFGYILANKLIKLFSAKKLLYALIFIASLSFISIFFLSPLMAIIPIFIMSFACGVRDIFVQTEIHKHTSSHQRATVLSVQNMSKSVMYALFAPIIGLFMDFYTPLSTFLMMGVVLFIFSIYIIYLFKNMKL